MTYLNKKCKNRNGHKNDIIFQAWFTIRKLSWYGIECEKKKIYIYINIKKIF